MTLSPVFDLSGEPTGETLNIIRDWNFLGNDSLREFLNFCREAFDETYGRWSQSFSALEIAPGGWSSNEAVTSAMQSNLFLYMYWQSSHRGGLVRYELPFDKPKPHKKPSANKS